MFRFQHVLAIAVFAAIPLSSSYAQEAPSSSSEYNPATAWRSFEELVRNWYAYIDRPSIDSERIFEHFRPLALSTANDAEFIDVLQLFSNNFADPHFIVGPFNDDDWSIIPTSADIYAEFDGVVFRVGQVREGSAADQAGVRRGARIVTVEGMTPAQAIQTVTGRPITRLRTH